MATVASSTISSPRPARCTPPIVRSPFAHARDRSRSTPRPRSSMPDVVDGRHGCRDRRADTSPSPQSSTRPSPCMRRPRRPRATSGEPVAVVVARDRYAAEDGERSRARGLRAARGRRRPRRSRRSRPGSSSPSAKLLATGRSDEVMRSKALSLQGSARASTFPRWTLHANRVLRRRLRMVGCDGLAHGVGELSGAVHAPLRRSGGAGSAGRQASPDHT